MSYLFFDKVQRFYIEVSNNYKTILMETMPLLSFVNQIHEQKTALLLVHTIPNLSFKDTVFSFRQQVLRKLNTILQIYSRAYIENGSPQYDRNSKSLAQWNDEYRLLKSTAEAGAN